MKKSNHLKGFTLIELLVVIAIIAILAAILFPVFAKAREKAMATTCTSNQRQIAASMMMYCQDHEESFPTATALWSSLTLDPGVMICPTKGQSYPNGYGIPRALANSSLGSYDDPLNVVLSADATIPTSNFDSTISNWGDIEARHGNTFIYSCLDGHVGTFRTSKSTWDAAVSKLILGSPAWSVTLPLDKDPNQVLYYSDVTKYGTAGYYFSHASWTNNIVTLVPSWASGVLNPTLTDSTSATTVISSATFPNSSDTYQTYPYFKVKIASVTQNSGKFGYWNGHNTVQFDLPITVKDMTTHYAMLLFAMRNDGGLPGVTFSATDGGNGNTVSTKMILFDGNPMRGQVSFQAGAPNTVINLSVKFNTPLNGNGVMGILLD